MTGETGKEAIAFRIREIRVIRGSMIFGFSR